MPDNLPQNEREAMLSAKARASGDECDCFDHGWLAHRRFSPSQTPTEDALREALEFYADHFNHPFNVSLDKGAKALSALSAAGPSEQDDDIVIGEDSTLSSTFKGNGRLVELERRLGTTEAHLDQALDLLDEVDRYVGFIQWELKDRLIDFLSRHRPKQ